MEEQLNKMLEEINATDSEYESERQMMMLALAELSLSRPGMYEAARLAASHFRGNSVELFESFRKTSSDLVKPHNLFG